MKTARLTWALVAMFLISLASPFSPAQDDSRNAPATKTGTFIRLQKTMDDDLPKGLQTSICRYVNKDSVRVDLIGAIHIGDPEYYGELNEIFKRYDVIPFEMVAPDGADVTARIAERSDNKVLEVTWKIIKMTLQLEFQQTGIDYSADNFVHADLSFEEMAATMRERGDSGLTLGLRFVADMIQTHNLQMLKLEREGEAEPSAAIKALAEADPLEVIKNPVLLKRVFAEQMASSFTTGLGKTLEQLLVVDRNGKAWAVTKKEIADGKKKIGIFYGAAHMPDFEKRLLANGFKYEGMEWVTAWDLRRSRPSLITEVIKLFE